MLSREHGRAPALGELCAWLGLKSRGSLHKHVRALADAGLVERSGGLRRGVRLSRRALDPGETRGSAGSAVRLACGPPDPVPVPVPAPATAGGTTFSLPWLGRIAAGRPIEAIEHEQSVDVPAHLVPGVTSALSGTRFYVLSVRGDSMSEEGILDGDWVVVEHREHARDGELVVALVDEREATLKRLEQRPDRCVLHPRNADYSAIELDPDRVRIQGVVVAQMRSYA